MNSKEFKQARQLAAEEFFWKELHLTNINVVESKLSQNNKHGILWIKIRNINHQKCLNTVAELSKGRLLYVKLLTKISSQFWARNKSLESNCYLQRQQNLNVHTQIHLGQVDLELCTKFKNDLFWKITPLEAYGLLEPPQTTTILKTPEGRQSKREANSPLMSEVKKKPTLGLSPQIKFKNYTTSSF